MLPSPSPEQAWVELRVTPPSAVFMADRLDGQRTPDGRYFQLPSARHELQTRYDFEIGSAGFGGDIQYLHCLMVLVYDGFQPGQRYLLEARALGYQPQVWLYDDNRQVLAEAQVARCH
uniref:PA0061/PA0062 family lipoprotein n=1 Tax=Stutzerimonas tarimensis TaxID=1507735 RepID=UPI0036D8A90E